MSIHALQVWIGQSSVGTLSQDDETDRFQFEYDPHWINNPEGYPVSPAIPFVQSGNISDERHSVSVRRFFENLLPEGQALDAAAAANRVSKANLYAVLQSLGRESTGALSLLPADVTPEAIEGSKRIVNNTELSERIRDRASRPFNVWDGRVRLSIAGLQDKLAVFVNEDKQRYLVDGCLSSTHILKPEPMNPNLMYLVANEHYCMNIAGRLGISVPATEVLRVPEAVLQVKRFDRQQDAGQVKRLHCIDACQALDLGVSHKYERNFGSNRDVAHIRDGVSLERLFSIAEQTLAEVKTRMDILRWLIFQYLVGNSDAHGKNITFYVEPGGLKLAPAYDMVSVAIYPGIEHEAAMAIGDEFNLDKLAPYDWTVFGQACDIPARVMEREMTRMLNGIRKEAEQQLTWAGYTADERQTLAKIQDICLTRADQMEQHIASKEIGHDFDA